MSRACDKTAKSGYTRCQVPQLQTGPLHTSKEPLRGLAYQAQPPGVLSPGLLLRQDRKGAIKELEGRRTSQLFQGAMSSAIQC